MWSQCAGPAAAVGFGVLPPRPPTPVEEPPRAAAPEDPAERLALSCLRHGRAAVDARDLPTALAWFDRALAVKPDAGIAHFCRAMVLADLGRHDEAAVALEASLGRGADDAAARIQFARLCARHGHYDHALRILGPAVTAKPHLAERIAQDNDFRAMRDHPFFLQMLGTI